MLEKTRNAVLEDVKRMSYQLVADRYGITRNQVAGIVWRAKNPIETRQWTFGPNGKRKSRNKCGRGRHGGGEYPAMTVYTHR